MNVNFFKKKIIPILSTFISKEDLKITTTEVTFPLQNHTKYPEDTQQKFLPTLMTFTKEALV